MEAQQYTSHALLIVVRLVLTTSIGLQDEEQVRDPATSSVFLFLLFFLFWARRGVEGLAGRRSFLLYVFIYVYNRGGRGRAFFFVFVFLYMYIIGAGVARHILIR